MMSWSVFTNNFCFQADLYCINKFLSSGMMTLVILPSASSAGNRPFFFLHPILVCLNSQAEEKGSLYRKPLMPVYFGFNMDLSSLFFLSPDNGGSKRCRNQHKTVCSCSHKKFTKQVFSYLSVLSWLAGCQASTKAPLSLPSTTGWQREKTMKDKGQERSLTKCWHGQNRLRLGICIGFITNEIRAV